MDGQITVHPIAFKVGSGQIKSNIVMTPQGDTVRTKADIEFQRVDVSRLMVMTQMFKGAGTISGTGNLDATGTSLSQMLGNGNGAIRVAMVGGDLSAMLVNLSGMQFGNALLSALGVPDRTKVECFVADAALQRGVATLRALVLDTGVGVVDGTGSVNLKSEAVDLELRTEPKHFSIGSLPGPISVTGTLKEPAIRPGAETVVRGGVAAGLGFLLAPLAALPTIQFGTADDERCERLLVFAKQKPGGQRLPGPAAAKPTR